MLVDKYQVAYMVISLSCFFSLGGAIAMILSVHLAQKRRRKELSSNTLLLSALFFMSICDLAWSTIYLVEFIPPSVGYPRGLHENRVDLCVSMGLLAQFFAAATRAWYFTIAVMALLLMMGYSTIQITRVFGKHIQHIFVWGLSTICSGLPLLGDGYGPTGHDGNECWIVGEDNPYRAVFFGPLFAFIAFDLMLFSYTIYVTYLLQIKDAWDVVIKQMLMFVGVFMVVWTLPAVNRLVEQTTGEVSPFWLWCIAMTFRGSAGFANFAVWYKSNIMENLMDRRGQGNGGRESISLEDSDSDDDTSFFAGSGAAYASLEDHDDHRNTPQKKPQGKKYGKKGHSQMLTQFPNG